MLSDANASATRNVQNTDVLIAAEAARVEEARKTAAAKIEEIQEQMRSCITALDRIKQANQPAPAVEASPVEAPAAAAPVQEPAPKTDADAVADEIAQNLAALVGTTVDTAPKAEPRHPVNDTTTSKFANLQFGRNYDPTHK